MTDAVIGRYSALEVLRQHGDTLVIRAAAPDGSSVIIKTHAQRLPTVETRARLRREYDSASATSHRHLSRARELIDQPSRSALVLDDHAGSSLASLLGSPEMDVERLLQVAIAVGSGALALHAAGLVHMAIDAEHIVVDGTTAALVDLYDACPTGTLPRRRSPGHHLAPEQCGRELAAADPASDQYAIAATINDAAEAGGLVLDDALLAALAKASQPKPADRYRSMLGFLADLRRAAAGAAVEELGEHDVALSWRNPRCLVGRGAVLDAVDEAVVEATLNGDGRIIVVRGTEGSGRSMLLDAVRERLSERGVVNGLGRFDPGGADPPLRAPTEAMGQIVAQVLAGPEPMVKAIRAELAERLGSDVALAEEIIPSLSHLVSVAAPPASPAPGSPVEMIARAERAVLNSIDSIARHATPLVLLFDDADQADAASIMSMRLLGRQTDSGPTVVVMAIDSGEDSTLAPTLSRLQGEGARVEFLDLAPLTETDVAEMIADGTGSTVGDVAELASAVWRRANGIPELVVNDVWSLIAGKGFSVDVESGRWVWTDDALSDADVTSIDEAALLRLQRLDGTARAVVVAAGLCERAASEEVLAEALGLDRADVHASIDRAVDARIIVLRPGIDEHTVASCADGGVRRAVLAMVDERERQHLALQLAHALQRSGAADVEAVATMSVERRFEIVRLMSLATDLLDSPSEREAFARLCGQAARDARRAAGYQMALDLQLRALDLLGERGWTTDSTRALTFDLHLYAAEHAMMVGRTALVDELLDRIAAHRPTPEQRVQTLRVLSSRWWTRQDTAGGLAEARALLLELGEPIPESPTWADVGREFVATRLALRNVQPESFLSGPRLDDERLKAVTETMLRCVHLAYVSDPITHTMLALRGTRLTVRHGVSDGSSYFLTAYAMLSCAFRTDVERALRFGRVGLALSEGKGGTMEAMVRFAYNGFVRHWGEPLATTIEPMIDQYRITIAARERGYGLTAGTFAVLHSVLSGQPLLKVDAFAVECAEDFERLGEHAFKMRVDVLRQAISDLRDGTAGREVLDGELFSTSTWLAAKRRHNELALMVHTLRATIAACADDRATMQRAVAAGAPMVRTAPGQAIVAQHWFLLGLAAADACATATTRVDRARERIRVGRALRWLRTWSAHGSSNVEHRIVLVEAALAHAGGDTATAMERYERAIRLARECDALPDLGIAAQRAAAFHDEIPGSTLVHHYVQLAHDAWQAWGATAVANQVIARYPIGPTHPAPAPFATDHLVHARQRPTDTTATTTTSDTFAQAGRLIGEELEVHAFLERLVEILIRHTSATRGYLVLQAPEGPMVEVAAHRVGNAIEGPSIASRLPSDHPDLCIPALNYSLRTREVLALVDPSADHRFRSDARLRERAPRALLCLPIGRSSATNGVLVMESDTFTHAFDADSVEALRVLSAQAIAAIENVRLTSDLGSLANDVADLRDRARALTAMAETDPLTGVANRSGLQSGFQAAMKALAASTNPSAEQRQLGVLFCDLDGFKAVNDRHGHAVGDEVLREVAVRLRRVVRTGDIVARVGGDEFVILSVDVPTAELHAISERASQELRRPIQVEAGPRVSVSASIGVTRAALDTLVSIDDMDAVLQIADQAMYRAKNAGKDQVVRT